MYDYTQIIVWVFAPTVCTFRCSHSGQVPLSWRCHSNLSLQSIMQYEEEKKSLDAAEIETNTALDSSLKKPKEKKEKKKKKKHKSERKHDGKEALSPSKNSKRKTTTASDTTIPTANLEEPGSFSSGLDTYPQQSGKTKRSIAVTAPGAVAVRAQEPDSFNTSHNSINQPDAKPKRTVAATSPGVVSVKVHEPDLFSTSMSGKMQAAPRSPRSPRSSQPKRTVEAIASGAVAVQKPGSLNSSRSSVQEEGRAPPRQSGKTKRTVAAVAPGAVAVQEPESLNTSNNSISEVALATPRQSVKTKRTIAATSPGAVAMKSAEPESFNTSRGSIQDEVRTAPRHSGKTKRTVAATAPGAVAVQEPESFNTSRGSISSEVLASPRGSVKTKRTVAATAPGAVAMKVEEPDSLSTSQGSFSTSQGSFFGDVLPAPRQSGKTNRTSKVNATIVEEPKTFHSSLGPIGLSSSSAIDKSGSDSANIKDDEAKRRYKSGRDKAMKPGVESLSTEEVLAVNEATRQKDPRLSARSSTRGRRSAGIAAVTAAAVGATAAATIGNEPEETNEAYRRRLNAKIDAMEGDFRRNRDAADENKPVSDSSEPNPALETSGSFSDLVIRKSERELSEVSEKSDTFKVEDKSEPVADPENVVGHRGHWDAFANDEDKLADAEDKLADDEDKGPPVEESTSETISAQGIIRPPDVEHGQVPGTVEGLAVAVAVEDENPFLPAALEYDPDSKPPLRYNRRFRLYAVVGAILLIALIVGVVTGVVNNKSSDTQEPTLAPTTSLEKSYRDQFVVEVGDQVNVPDSPYDRAAQWIMYDDPLKLSPEAPNLIQRYHLALLYYLTTKNGKERWNSCTPPMANETESCTFQSIEFTGDQVEYTTYVPIPDMIRWMAGINECQWIGVFCDPTMNVVALQIGE